MPSAARASMSARAQTRASRAASSKAARPIALAGAQARLAERDEHLGTPSSRCAAAGEYSRRARADRPRPPRPAARPRGERRRTHTVGEGRLGVGAGAGRAHGVESAASRSPAHSGPFGQRGCDAAMGVTPPRRRQLSDQRVSHERVRNANRRPRQLPHQARAQRLVERVQHHLLPLTGARPHQLGVELRPGNCRKLEQPSCPVPEPADACGDDVEHGVRERAPSPAPRAGQLANEERIPARSLAQRRGRGPIWARPRQRLHDGGNGRLVEPVQGHSYDRPVAPYLGERLRERVARASLDVPGASEQEAEGRAEAVWPGGARGAASADPPSASRRGRARADASPRPLQATRRRRRTFGPGRSPGQRPARLGGLPCVPRGRPRGRQGSSAAPAPPRMAGTASPAPPHTGRTARVLQPAALRAQTPPAHGSSQCPPHRSPTRHSARRCAHARTPRAGERPPPAAPRRHHPEPHQGARATPGRMRPPRPYRAPRAVAATPARASAPKA